jgi:argininosuccinate synthase
VVKSHVAGVTPREVREAPAAVVLHAAHRQLRRLVTAKDLARFHRSVSLQYSDIICDGRWFTPMRGALDAFVEKVQEVVTGVIRLKLFKGACRVVGRTSAHAPYHQPPAACHAGDTFDHGAATRS